MAPRARNARIMDLERYHRLVSSEPDARIFLIGKCLERGPLICPRCGERKHYALRDHRRRCSSCRYTFHEFSGRWINHGRFSSVQWLSLVKFFEMAIPEKTISAQMDIHPRTARRALDIIRLAILAHDEDAPLLLALACEAAGVGLARHLPKPPQAAMLPVFGIQERQGLATAAVLPGESPDLLLTFPLKTLQGGRILYTEKCPEYDCLLYCGTVKGKTGPVPRIQAKKSDRAGRFWRWARRKLEGEPVRSPQSLALHLKELAFRYNHKDDDVFEKLTGYLCDFVPQAD